MRPSLEIKAITDGLSAEEKEIDTYIVLHSQGLCSPKYSGISVESFGRIWAMSYVSFSAILTSTNFSNNVVDFQGLSKSLLQKIPFEP